MKQQSKRILSIKVLVGAFVLSACLSLTTWSANCPNGCLITYLKCISGQQRLETFFGDPNGPFYAMGLHSSNLNNFGADPNKDPIGPGAYLYHRYYTSQSCNCVGEGSDGFDCSPLCQGFGQVLEYGAGQWLIRPTVLVQREMEFSLRSVSELKGVWLFSSC
jgi:hypothetical protein